MGETLAVTPTNEAESLLGPIQTLIQAGVLTPVGADFAPLFDTGESEDVLFDRFENIGRFLGHILTANRFWLADWLLFGEGAFGDRFYQAAEATGLSEGTLQDWIRIGEKVPRSRRRPELHFSHHREVAKMEPEAQTYWLDRAVERGLSVRDLREEIEQKREADNPRIGDDPGPHPDINLVRVDRSLLAAIVHEAAEADDPRYRLVPDELVVRLAATIGEE